MGSSTFEAGLEMAEGGVVVRLIGELDIDTVPILKESLGAIDPEVTSIVVDMRELAFMDSSGLSALLQSWKETRVEGRRFCLAGVNDGIQRLLKITGTEFLLSTDGEMSVA